MLPVPCPWCPLRVSLLASAPSDPVKDSVRDSVEDLVRDSVKPFARDSVRDSARDYVKGSARDSVKGFVKHCVKHSVRDSGRPRFPNRIEKLDCDNFGCRQASRQADGQTGRQTGRQAGRQVSGQMGRQAWRKAGKQASRQASRQTGRQVGREADRQAGRQTGRQAGRENQPSPSILAAPFWGPENGPVLGSTSKAVVQKGCRKTAPVFIHFGIAFFKTHRDRHPKIILLGRLLGGPSLALKPIQVSSLEPAVNIKML